MTPVDPDFEVSYDARPFLRPSPRVLAHCERYFDDNLPRLVQWPDPNVYAGGLQQYNLPLPPAPPRPRLNRFFYPFGLVRWATFWGVMRGDDVAALALACFGSGGPTYKDFLIQSRADGATTATEYVRTPMMMLPPYKLAQVEDDNETLYLVQLVDERYESRTARFVTTSQPSTSAPSWGATETVDAAYSGLTLAGPAGSKSTAGNQNHSTLCEYALYDHAASCLGMVWVRDFQPTAGKYLYRTRWETANALAHTDKVGAFADVTDRPLAGNAPVSFELAATTSSRKAVMPATVRVGFPAVRAATTGTGTLNLVCGETNDGKPSWYWRTVSAPVGLPVGNKLAAVTTQQPATYSSTPKAADTPTNSVALTTLADQIGEDFYHALVGAADVAYAGLTPLNPRWACDLTIDFATYEGERTQTRIARDPFNAQYAVDLLIGKDLSPRVRTTAGGFQAIENGDAIPLPVGGVPNLYVFPAGLYVYPGEKICVHASAAVLADASHGVNSFWVVPYAYNFDTGTTSPLPSNSAPQLNANPHTGGGVYPYLSHDISANISARVTTTVVFEFDASLATAKYAIGFRYGLDLPSGGIPGQCFGVFTATFT